MSKQQLLLVSRKTRMSRRSYVEVPLYEDIQNQRVKREILAFSVAQRGRIQREEPISSALRGRRQHRRLYVGKSPSIRAWTESLSIRHGAKGEGSIKGRINRLPVSYNQVITDKQGVTSQLLVSTRIHLLSRYALKLYRSMYT